jgi:hypothetical protein
MMPHRRACSVTEPEAPAVAADAPPREDVAEIEDTRELLMMLAVLLVLLVIAAVVFLFVPTEWIGAKVEVIVHQ